MNQKRVELVAFDYERQEWMEGEAARALLIGQLTKERALLMGPRANEFVGKHRSISAALARCEAEIKQLKEGEARIAGQGASELGHNGNYFRVLITYAHHPSSCFKVEARDVKQVEESMDQLCPFYAKNKGDAVSIRIDDWRQFSAVLTRNVQAEGREQ